MSHKLLFNQGTLRDFLENKKKEIHEEIETLSEEYILNINMIEYKEYLLKKYFFTTPNLKKDEIYIDKKEESIDVSQDLGRVIIDRSKPFYIKGLKIIYHIPYDGDDFLFEYRTSQYTLNPPYGEISSNELLIEISALDKKSSEIKSGFDKIYSEINKWLGWVNQEVSNYNSSITSYIESIIEKRKSTLLKNSDLVSDLGFPLKKRKDSKNTYTVPEIKKKVEIKKPTITSSSKPEPTIDIDEYENILKILSNMTYVMERSPKDFSKMDEESIRQHFLVQLNGQYEGQATGETFNYEGKTDILIRHEGKNLFICECKFWKGKENLLETIDQILGYLSWRDSKTAIILFNKNKDMSKVISQIPSIVKVHNNFKKELKYEDETGFRYLFNHKNDSGKELYLTILIFDIPE